MASLRTNYKDDILSGDRKYRMITNSDGTVSFQDVTDYTQEGDTFGALDINATNTAVNALQEANGDTDISGIGDGTNTGAIHTLNTHLNDKEDKVYKLTDTCPEYQGATTIAFPTGYDVNNTLVDTVLLGTEGGTGYYNNPNSLGITILQNGIRVYNGVAAGVASKTLYLFLKKSAH